MVVVLFFVFQGGNKMFDTKIDCILSIKKETLQDYLLHLMSK
ncbi:hypothetical protein RV15_GL001584 [Enterococcus silesiacus]|uniref:Uncharacterized protein n=1 Tax=Enterococcus silesiacus TaxID=332949 RepID=A0AA91GH34_9ENTE|nr:hypothetical protein RV15_GL001584 [Enterococcus silesiacus]